MVLVRVAIGALSFLALTAALADEAPKAPKNPDPPYCRSLPKPGSHIKAYVCGTPDLYRYVRWRNDVLSISAPAGIVSSPGGSTSDR
jgi:hypothetical protein